MQHYQFPIIPQTSNSVQDAHNNKEVLNKVIKMEDNKYCYNQILNPQDFQYPNMNYYLQMMNPM